jgi:hypothetical protein
MRAAQILSVLLLLTAAACSGVQAAGDPSKPPPPETTVSVRNQKYVDFDVYVLDGTHRLRLGSVPSLTTRVFTIPPHLVIDRASLRFQLDPIGSDDVRSTDEAVQVREGGQVELTIQ